MAEVRPWKEKRALKSLEEGKVSFWKAAKTAGLSVWELADLVREKGIVWIKSEKFISRDIKKGASMKPLVFDATPLIYLGKNETADKRRSAGGYE